MKQRVVSKTGVIAMIGFSLFILLAANQGRAQHNMHTFSGEVPNNTAAPVNVTVPVGNLIVEAWDQPRVEVEARLHCNPFWGSLCRSAAGAISLRVAPNEAGVIVVQFDGWPESSNRGMRAEVTVHMPRAAAVATTVGVGKATISRLEGNVSADVGVGGVEVDSPERTASKVNLQAGVGMASLITASGKRHNRSPLGAQLSWKDGAGQSKISVSCGVGRSRVRLTK
jgi:hypothetical protein